MAENPEGQEKTETATAKRLSEARDRGQVSKSQDVTTAAILLIGTLMVFLLGPPVISDLKNFMRHSFIESTTYRITEHNIQNYYINLLSFLAQVLLPVICAIFVIALMAEIGQVGFHFATKKFSEGLNFKQVFNPFSGMKRMFFSGRSYFELLKSIIKIFILGIVVYQVLASHQDDSIALIEKPFMEFGNFLISVSLELIVKVGGIFILIAAGDFMYQKFKFAEDMKMTKQETKEENKQMECDPRVRARIRNLMRQRIRKLMLDNVKNADVVIANPTHFAVALKYDQNQMNAPVCLAKGVDFLALQIRERAESLNIPVVENPPLARALFFSAQVDREIPEALFRAVAQVLAYVMSLKNKAKF